MALVEVSVTVGFVKEHFTTDSLPEVHSLPYSPLMTYLFSQCKCFNCREKGANEQSRRDRDDLVIVLDGQWQSTS